MSIPAPFRKVLEREAQPGLVLIPELRNEPAVEGLGYSQFDRLAEAIDAMNPLDPATIALADKVMGRAVHATVDETGRIVLSEPLRDLLSVEDKVLFVGMGNTFQIWNPETYAARRAQKDETANANFHRLPWGRAAGAGTP